MLPSVTIRLIARRIPGARRAWHLVRGGSPPPAPSYYAEKAWKKIRIDRDVPVFSDIARRIIEDGRTFLIEDRLYTLWQGLQGMPADALVVEVGVYQGGSTRFLAEAMHFLGKTGEVYACDTFSGHATVDEQLDGEHRVNEVFSDVSLAEVRAYLAEHPRVHIVVGDVMERSDDVPAGPIGLLHVDVDVYPATKYCLERFGSRVPSGGVIIVDDYGFTTCAGAKAAVDEFIASSSGWRLFHLLSGQALLVRTLGGAGPP
jgi:predicted O-methyltransferase YrrM